MENGGLGGAPGPELEHRALRRWVESLPEELWPVVARDARVHVPRRERKRAPTLIWERCQRSPYSRAVISHWFRKYHESLVQRVRTFTGPVEPDGIGFCRELRSEEQLDLPTLLWAVWTAGRPDLQEAVAQAFPDEWDGLRRERLEAGQAAAPDTEDEQHRLRRALRDAREEVRRLRAAVVRSERELAGWQHRVGQAQRRLSQEAARQQELRAEVEAAERRRGQEQARWQAQLAEVESAFARERAGWQEQVQAVLRAVRERDLTVSELSARLRRSRHEAERFRTMYLTLETYLELTAPGDGVSPEGFTAYGNWLERRLAELALQCTPQRARELASQLAALETALLVHRELAGQLRLPEATREPVTHPLEGPLVREVDGDRDRFYIRLPDRFHPIDPAVVAAVGAFPGDLLALEPRCERTPGGAHFYLYYHLRSPRRRVEEIAIIRPGGPPWWAETSRGAMPVLGTPDRQIEAGQPVVVLYPEEWTDDEPAGCLVMRVLPCDPPVRTPAQRSPRTSGEREPADRDRSRRRPPLLAGRTIYILGGEGFETYYRQVVESYGGQLLWTSGFNELRQIGHRVRQADAVVLVTRGVSHKAYDHLQAAVSSTGRPLFYCNALGQSQLERVLEKEVIPSLSPAAGPG